MDKKEHSSPLNFIQQIITADIKAGKNQGQVITRFPPEPNGYLHIGHAKSICINFGLANQYHGKTFLRFDDTNPSKESVEYTDSIKDSVKWLGFEWEDRLRYASDYFDELFKYAIQLIKSGNAYVCSLKPEEIKAQRGTLKEPGTDSPYRDRSVDENLELFEQMKAGRYANGEHVLRVKIDMASPNINLRDPVIYRILKVPHHRTGDKWCIYPLYDFTHCLSDAIEGITHSLCSLEFADHRPLYDWVLNNTDSPCHPQQIEFSRLALYYTVTSKRKLSKLVETGCVNGWDDPRMPTLMGMRRRGYTPAAIREFCARIGVTKKENYIEMSALETCVREDLDQRAPRVMAVLRPLKVIIENYPDEAEEMNAPFHPYNEAFGTRKLPFSKELYIEQDDFMEDPPKKFFRLKPGGEVRLRYGYIIKCESVVRDPETGTVDLLKCSYDPDTRSGSGTSTKKVKGTIHWVSAQHAVDAEVRLYDRLFTIANPTGNKEGKDFKEFLNPDSVEILKNCKLEQSLSQAISEDPFQFERQGYFCVDRHDSNPGRLVFNRTVTLRDSWAKIEKANQQQKQKKQ
jgi:glutaminyl-tRNA synthetase